ncbi:MAG: AmmeMemoRadiSam system radical SAM enzyme [Candidatus Omnitrophica bacterium]|nr:AmmeMemoRadiSam system radical SAM enzyme [Candidatus Omnitrophota bacterium]
MRKKALLWKKDQKDTVLCGLCGHRCVIAPGDFGFCGMRENIRGELYTYAYGEVIANHADPIEKKPLYHFLPGSGAYSIATIGCNFRCSFCQNWRISQLSVRNDQVDGYELSPEEVVREAVKNRCSSIAYTYTEPTIFFEYAYDISKLSGEKGLRNIFITNGYMTPEAVALIAPYLDAANVDLKFFSDKTYRKLCGAKLGPVLDSIAELHKNGIWVEVTTLVVPGENDSESDLRGIASFLAGVSRDIPWHVSRFHPDYKVMDKYPTMNETLLKAKEIGLSEGLKYVYIGNTAADNDTYCPGCGEKLIARGAFSGEAGPAFDPEGKCASCGESIAGVWK